MVAAIEVRVACATDSGGEEVPHHFFIGEYRVEVAEVVDRWLAADHRYFKVRGDDAAVYILRHGEGEGGSWQLAFYERGAER